MREKEGEKREKAKCRVGEKRERVKGEASQRVIARVRKKRKSARE